MKKNLPPLDITEPSPRAREAAEILLRGFHHQDLREKHLVACDFAAARVAAKNATEHMSQSFKIDFPNVAPDGAKRAGTLFMQALFLQDEIENRAEFYECLSESIPEDIFVDVAEVVPGLSINDDPRWELVQELLYDVCEEIDIDNEYAVLHSRFWRLHGQRRDGWRSIARRAHRIKLARMVPTATAHEIDKLSEYFVAGVDSHDNWCREDPKRDIESTVDIVARYYQCVFELRER